MVDIKVVRLFFGLPGDARLRVWACGWRYTPFSYLFFFTFLSELLVSYLFFSVDLCETAVQDRSVCIDCIFGLVTHSLLLDYKHTTPLSLQFHASGNVYSDLVLMSPTNDTVAE